MGDHSKLVRSQTKAQRATEVIIEEEEEQAEAKLKVQHTREKEF
jgi:hypothetical protein